MTYHVIGVKDHNQDITPWVLGLTEKHTMETARGAVNWQGVGDAFEFDFVVCERTGPDTFKDVSTGKQYTVENSCFTKAAWDEFLNSWSDCVPEGAL